jgi:cysteine-S-conjugate beta-lyase
MQRRGSDGDTLRRLFGRADGVIPLWIAEPSVELAPAVRAALEQRAAVGWFGYETRPASVVDAFRDWMAARHGWDGEGLNTSVSPSVNTSIAVLVDQFTEPGDGVILQPPVFTEFKPIVTGLGRNVRRNPLVLTDAGYRMDLDDLAAHAAAGARLLVLCNPHNPVGRVWTREELAAVAEICAAHDVFVVADEIHADLALPPHRFTPFGSAAAGRGVRWAATHGPVKTFGLAGVCDSLVLTDRGEVADRFETASSRFHLLRNNVFGLAAFEAAYREGADWLDDLLTLVARNVAVLRDDLPDEIGLVEPEGTYLAWLDLTALELEVPAVGRWLAAAAGIAVSPGHWFGREGSGYVRMTTAVPTGTIERAVAGLHDAVRRRAAH